MVINTNTSAQAAATNLAKSEEAMGQSLARLSSGSKITNAADDAAGLAESLRLDTQVQRLGAVSANIANAVSLLQTQDGYFANVEKALNRMGELAILALDGTKTDADKSLYTQEYTELTRYIDSVATKEFNGVSLFSSDPKTVTVDSEGGTLSMEGINMDWWLYQFDSDGPDNDQVSSYADAWDVQREIKASIIRLSAVRAKVGAYLSRLSLTAEQLATTKDNLTAASSRIRDVDVAQESTEYAREKILVQTGTAMVAQANQVPEQVLKLLP